MKLINKLPFFIIATGLLITSLFINNTTYAANKINTQTYTHNNISTSADSITTPKDIKALTATILPHTGSVLKSIGIISVGLLFIVAIIKLSIRRLKK